MSNNRELGYVVGAVAGYFTGGASYIALGATIGGAVGGLLDPKTQTQGPRLDDLRVQMSTYGIGIPRLYGTERMSPNVIWSTDKIEMSSTTSTGKGGGGTENTSYRYYVHMRLLLCETPRDGSEVQIVQIFSDGKLQWDARSGISIESALASAENPFAFHTLYQGLPDQLPDAVEELYEAGPGSVPAYRGVVSISMKGIECPGGRVPQFSFVLSNNATVGVEVDFGTAVSIEPVSDDLFQGISYSRAQPSRGPVIVFAEDGQPLVEGELVQRKVIRVFGVGLDYVAPVKTLLTSSAYNYRAVPGHGDIDLLVYREVPTDTYVDSAYNVAVDAEGVKKRFLLNDIVVYGQSTSLWAKFGNRIAFTGDENQLSYDAAVFDYEAGTQLGRLAGAGADVLELTEDFIWIIDDVEVRIYDVDDFSFIAATPLPADLTDGSILYSKTDGVNTLGAWRGYASGGTAVWTLTASTLGVVTGLKIADDPTAAVPPIAAPSVTINGKIVSGVTLAGAPGTYSVQVFVVNYGAVTAGGRTVASIIAAECEVAGETRYDVSGIPDEDVVLGYKIGAPASARANIDPLLTAFQIFIVDEDELIKFKKYADITSVATITFDELGQAEDGSDPSDPMPLTRTQEIDMPKSVSVSYIEPLNDYQVATEREIRQITEATEDVLVQLSVAITSDQAKKAATNVLFSTWRSQNTRSLSVSRKYAFVSPGDGTTVEYPRGTFRLWRWRQVTDTGALMEGTVEPGDAALYTHVATGATGYVGQQVPALPPPTHLTILDTPILRDADNDAGAYVALAGTGPSWPGAELFIGPDETSLQSRGTVQNQSAYGSAANALSDWDSNIVDESSVLMVNVGSATLNSITRAALLTGTDNVAAVGANGRWEIIKFQRATSLGDGLYMLTGLMRGLRGTEWARGLHEIGDTFAVMSTAGMLRVNLSAGEIGQAQIYTAVTAGRPFARGTTQTYANTAEGLEPFSPANLVKDFDGDDITLQWVRRTRLSENWLMGIVPLGEVSERWQVVIYSDDTFATAVRTINTTTASAVYTSAMQVADFGSNQTEISVRIAQISDVVGAGHELEETL